MPLTRLVFVGLLCAVGIFSSGCADSGQTAPSRIKSAVLFAGSDLVISAEGADSDSDTLRLPAGNHLIALSKDTVIGFSAERTRRTWDFKPNLSAGQLYRFVADGPDLYMIKPLVKEAYRFERVPSTQPAPAKLSAGESRYYRLRLVPLL